MSCSGHLLTRQRGFAENTPTAPNGNWKPAKAGFSWVFRGAPKPAFAGFPSNLRVGPPESRGACKARPAGRFLDGKRGFLTRIHGLLSVLFDTGIRSSRTGFWTCSGTPFCPGPGRKCLVLPFELVKSRQKLAQKVTKTGPVLTSFPDY